MKLFTFALLVLGISLSACAQGQPELSPSQQKAIQDFVFTTLEGQDLKISDFKGKVIVLDFWETWCGPCLRFMPTLSKVQKDFKDDFVAIAVSPGWSDTQTDVENFVAEHDYGFTHVFGKELAKTLKIAGIPFKVYVAADGTVIKAQMGISGSAEIDYNELAEFIKANKAK